MSVLERFKLVELITTRTDSVATFIKGNIIKFNNATCADLGYPAYIQLFVEEKGKQFAIKTCREDAPNAIKFSKSASEQRYPVKIMENQDGIDLRTGCHDITISNITGGTGDDLIALTAIADNDADENPDGNLTCTHILANDWTRRSPDIHDIIIRNVIGYSKGGLCFHIRLLPSNSYIWNVVIDGVIDNSPKGFRAGGVLLLGSFDGDYGVNLPDSMRNILISNISCDSSRAIVVDGYLSDSVITNVVNRNPDCPVIDVARPGGMKNVMTANLFSAGNVIISD